MVLLVNHTAVELYVWIGDLGCGQLISMSVLRSVIIFLYVTYRAAISYLAAEAITALTIYEIVNTRPLSFGLGSFSEIYIWAPALLRAFGPLKILRLRAPLISYHFFEKGYHRQGISQHNQVVFLSRLLFIWLSLLSGIQLHPTPLGVCYLLLFPHIVMHQQYLGLS